MLKQNTTKFYVGGQNLSNISSWIESVTLNSKPIKTDLIALYDFIEPNSNSERKQSLKLMVDLIGKRATLEILKYFLEQQNSSHLISKFLLESVRSQMSSMCPSNAFVNSIKSGIFQERNLRFKRYNLFCMHDVKDDYVKSIVVSLIPGLCFTKDENIGYCVRSRITYPPGIKCMLLYKLTKCDGQVYANISVSTSSSELQDALNDPRSFAYC